MAHELIEVSILIAALNKELGEVKDLIGMMNPNERRKLQLAIFKIEDVIDDMDQDEAETKLGTGKGVSHG